MKRFWDKVQKTDGCWLWIASKFPAGHGQFSFNGRSTPATHVSWFLEHGVLPKFQMNHKCDTPSCVRPDHLFDGTQSENILDCVKKGRHRAGRWQATKTHCPKGHAYSLENTRYCGRKRTCRACTNARAKTNFAKKRNTLKQQMRLELEIRGEPITLERFIAESKPMTIKTAMASLGVSRRTIARWLAGSHGPTTTTMQKKLAALHIVLPYQYQDNPSEIVGKMLAGA